MLKPLLLLCWAAIFVSAGDQKNVITNDTSVPIGLTRGNVAANSQLPLENTKLPVSTSSENMHVPTVQTESLASSTESSNLYPDTKPNIPTSTSTVTVSSKTTYATNSSTVTLKPTTKPTTTTPSSTTTSTTTAVPTTLAPTTPLPPPSTAKWTVKENNTLCIIVQMAAQLNVSYTNANNVTIYKAIDIPSNINATGVCGINEQNLTVSWKVQDAIEDSFTLHFVKNETNKHYSLHHLEISLAPGEFPVDNSNKTVTLVHIAPQYDTALSNSYRCLKEQKLDLTFEDKNVTIGHLIVSNLQFQAFRSDNTTNFGLAKDCAFDTPDIVPITVGCALAGLVVIVLIAYLVGRRRSQARGYLSM